MKTDELAFFNQQLAVMLRDHIPLEGALRQLTSGMAEGRLRSEFERLEADLGRGQPLTEALAVRNLPDFYKQMLSAGAASNDLPGMLTLLADHYTRTHALWLRLRGLMVYPLIVITISLLVALLVSSLMRRLMYTALGGIFPPHQDLLLACAWLAPLLLALAALLIVAAFSVPRLRAWARWRIPAFREASIAQLASSMQVMLRGGSSLPDSLAFAEKLEDGSPAAPALAEWRSQITRGEGKLGEWRDSTKVLPPLLLWLVKSSREDPAAGFKKAAELYNTRSAYRTELLLYGALPVSVLLLGQMVIWQVVPVFRTLIWFMNSLGDMGS